MKMSREVGSVQSAVWLLGDSKPAQWESRLATPLDPRHPARHSIWTPVLDAIQDDLFRTSRVRLDAAELYIRNAVEDPAQKPGGGATEWSASLMRRTREFGSSVNSHEPLLLLSFGAFAFEFARRALLEVPNMPFSHWGARTMGDEFRRRLAAADANSTNLLPLLHVTIARGKFIQSHEYFTGKQGGNYFNEVGIGLAGLLRAHGAGRRLWIL